MYSILHTVLYSLQGGVERMLCSSAVLEHNSTESIVLRNIRVVCENVWSSPESIALKFPTPSWCPDGKSSWNGQWTAAKRRSAALTLSGYFCTNSRTLLALPWAASMTSRLGLSCSVDWESSFSNTEMTVPEQADGEGGKGGGKGCEKRTDKRDKNYSFS